MSQHVMHHMALLHVAALHDVLSPERLRLPRAHTVYFVTSYPHVIAKNLLTASPISKVQRRDVCELWV